MWNIIKVLFAIGILASIWSCKGDPGITQERDTILDIRLDRDPDRINPMIYPKPTSRHVFQNIFRGCANIDPFTLEMTPLLIESIPKKVKHEDGTISFTIKFREEASWPDGSPITAEDYDFTLKAIAHPKVNAASYRSFTQNISKVEYNPKSPKTLTITLSEDYLLALETIATLDLYPRYVYDRHNRLATVSLDYLYDPSNEKAIEEDSSLMAFASEMNGQKFSQEIAIGAGPYQLSSYLPNKKIVLKEVDNYWGNSLPEMALLHSGPEQLVFHVVPDKTAALNLLKEGDLDLMSNIEGSDFMTLQETVYASERLNFISPKLARFYFLMLNTLSPELSDVRVRRALEYTIDLKTIIEVLERGMAFKINSPIRPTASYHDKSLPEQTFDIKKANELLDDAGWLDNDKDGIREKEIDGKKVDLRLKMSAAPGKLSGEMGQIIKSDAIKAGIDIDLIEKTPKLFGTENIKTGDFHIAAQALSQSLELYDPYQKWHSDNAFKGSNYSGYQSPDMDKLINEIRNEQNMDLLTEKYHKFQQMIDKAKPVIFLYSPSAKIAYSKNWDIKSSIVRPGYFANTARPKN